MKIIGVGYNYRPHREEASERGFLSGHEVDEPIFFHKGDALLRPNTPFFLPDMGSTIEYEAELVVQISRVGKQIAERFAHRYYNYITLGIDFTARDIQRRAIAQGHPWLMAKVFDGSAVVGYQTLRMGDLIFTGTPSGVGPIQIGQLLEGYIGERRVLQLSIK